MTDHEGSYLTAGAAPCRRRPDLFRTAFSEIRNTLQGTPQRVVRRIERREKKLGDRTVVEPLRIKHHSLTGRIDLKLMYEAFRAVKRNKGKAGVDRVSIEMFAQHLDQNLTALMRDLKQGTYEPLPVRRAYIEKGGGKLRPLGIPTVSS